jgi:hypothetical protein
MAQAESACRTARDVHDVCAQPLILRGGYSRRPNPGPRASGVHLADVHGIRASLGEQGAQRVGKDYNVEPVAVSSGCAFHPKISVLSDKDECHVLVGSGNLTFNGWGGNIEVQEHLHPSFAADAIGDMAEFFELLPVTERVRLGAGEDCAAIAADLRRSVRGKPTATSACFTTSKTSWKRCRPYRGYLCLVRASEKYVSLPSGPSGAMAGPESETAIQVRRRCAGCCGLTSAAAPRPAVDGGLHSVPETKTKAGELFANLPVKPKMKVTRAGTGWVI